MRPYVTKEESDVLRRGTVFDAIMTLSCLEIINLIFPTPEKLSTTKELITLIPNHCHVAARNSGP